jgi:hypothetical protein
VAALAGGAACVSSSSASKSAPICGARRTYDASDEPLEVVVSVRPANSNVIIFETYEGPAEETEEQQTANQPAAARAQEGRPS